MPVPPQDSSHTAPARLLVVDDNEMNRDMLSRRLAKRGHAVEVAEDGLRALDRIRAAPFDLVLLDEMMPGIDGFEVLRRIRETYSPTQLPVIMATAKDQPSDIVQALEAGASDYVTKPLEFPVVMARVGTQLALKRSVDQIVALEADLSAQNKELERVNAKMKRDLRTAAKLQKALLPGALPKTGGTAFAWLYAPCDELAGDILSVYELDEHHAGMYLLDVSGHGVPAALLSVTLSRVLAPVPGRESLVMRDRAGVLEPTPPVEVLKELNRRFPMDGAISQYFTMIYGVLDTRTGELRYSCAGHAGPAVVRADGTAELLESPALAIGWDPDAVYEDLRLTLRPGDRVYIYSDGISEVLNPHRKQLGNSGVLAALGASRGSTLEHSLESIKAAAQAWGGAPFDDDVSAVALEVRPPG